MRAKFGARNLTLALAFGVLAGCSSSPSHVDLSGHGKSRGYYKVGAPYQINGVWYYPRVDYEYDETGIASWYGEAFHGKPTANGEIFDLNKVSAAHKTLQLPSVVEVTNLKNGRALQMRVNDRGPFVGDRVIDLSRRASQLLGFEGAGTAPVRVRIMKEESIRVAEAAMRGDISPSALAEAPRTAPVQMAPAAPRQAPVQMAAAPPRPAPAIPAPAPYAPSPVVYAAPPAPTPPAVAVAQATPPAAALQTLSPPAAASSPVVAAARRPWPSVIGTAQAAPAHAAAAPQMASASARQGGRIFVQAGAFAVPENAHRVRARVASLGGAEVLRATVNGAEMYRVRVGPVASDAEARRLLGRVVDSGYPGARIVDQ